MFNQVIPIVLLSEKLKAGNNNIKITYPKFFIVIIQYLTIKVSSQYQQIQKYNTVD